MRRSAAVAYGTLCYLIFFGTFLYLVGFIANLGVPKSIDSGTPGSLVGAVAVNLGLLLVFGLQHSVMARPGFKAWWTRFVPRPVERSTYVLASSAALILLFWAWQPMADSALWRVEGALRPVVQGVYFLGVGLVLYATLLIDHFDLFGLRQVILHWKDAPYTEKRFMTPSLYRFVRHPLYVGWFVVMWATPDMTLGHLIFAAANTLYMRIAIGFEERDLEQVLGEDYRTWKSRTPMFVPRLRRRPVAVPGTAVPAPARVR